MFFPLCTPSLKGSWVHPLKKPFSKTVVALVATRYCLFPFACPADVAAKDTFAVAFWNVFKGKVL